MGAGVIDSGSGGGGGSRRRRRGRARPMSEINVTPFVDVMLVLLIIFMVSAPLLTVGVEVDLPETAANTLPTEQEEPLTLTITDAGEAVIQTTPVTDDDIVARLTAILSERTSDRVFLRADGTVPYARVVQIMGALNAAGITNIALVTDTGGPTLTGADG